MLPFEPESFDTLKARVPVALAPLIEPLECAAGADAPSTKRQHVFDFLDGLRLIVSRDSIGTRAGKPQEWLHVSASVHEGTLLDVNMRTRAGFWTFCGVAFEAAVLLLDLKHEGGMDPQLITEKGVPHWYLPAKVVEAVEVSA